MCCRPPLTIAFTIQEAGPCLDKKAALILVAIQAEMKACQPGEIHHLARVGGHRRKSLPFLRGDLAGRC